MPGVVVFYCEGVECEFQVVSVGIGGGVLLHVLPEVLFGDGEANYGERTAGRVDDEGLEVGEEAGELVGGALEGCPVAAGSVEAEPVVVCGFAAGDLQDLGIYEAHQADAGRFFVDGHS